MVVLVRIVGAGHAGAVRMVKSCVQARRMQAADAWLPLAAALTHVLVGPVLPAQRSPALTLNPVPASPQLSISLAFRPAQGYALFKHMTVADNITFGPRMRKMNIDLEKR